MGPAVNNEWSSFELRPFQPSNTLDNLERTREGVLHITDQSNLFASAVTGQWKDPLEFVDSKVVCGKIIHNCCRALEFTVKHLDRSENRSSVQCEVVQQHYFRDFDGFNRARNAVVEASILASRVMFLPLDSIQQQFSILKPIVERTGGNDEISDFVLIEEFVRNFNKSTENVEHE